VVATDSSNEPEHLLAAHICSILWQVARIVNVVIVIPHQFAYCPLQAMSTTKTTAADRLNFYTWFPFKLGRCGDVQDAILLDEWVIGNNGRFSENAHLYPAKVPKHFMGCPIKVGTAGIEPCVIPTENYKQNDGSTASKVTGFSVEILKLVCEKMNLTTIFLPPSLNMELDSFVKETAELEEDLSDVLTGTLPLIPLLVTSSFDATIPYTHINIKMLVPCPKAIPGTEKILTTFSLSVWLTMGLALLLTLLCSGVPLMVPTGLCVMKHTHISHCPTVSTMLGLCLWECLFHSSPQILASEFSSFCTSVSVSLSALYSKHSLFRIWWNRSMKIR
jgi:hypothetical protein